MPLNRIVVLLSPIFVGVAGWVVTLAAKYLPGHPHLDQASLRDLFIAGALFAAAHVAQWVHGWQNHESAVPVKPESGMRPTAVDIAEAEKTAA